MNQSAPVWQLNEIDQSLIDLAFSEDIGATRVDATTAALFADSDIPYEMKVVSKELRPIVVCGEALVREIYAKISPEARLDWRVKDGQLLAPNDVLFTVKGSASGLMLAERVVLNFLQRLSAVATITASFVALTQHTDLKILDTRKTSPGMRHLEKYAVFCGGGANHRFGLYDAIMIKDNHIDLIGGMEKALLRLDNTNNLPVIVEVRTVEELVLVLEKGQGIVSRVLLDNMSVTQLSECVALNNATFETEASGGIHLGTIGDIANTGVNYASIGALTHSAGSVDLSMQAMK